jgi:hypothetical protein
MTIAYAIVAVVLGVIVVGGFTFAFIWHRLPGD